jgi:hypothetical protein
MAAARPEVFVSCFGIPTLSSVEREILPVWQPPSNCVSGLGRCKDIVDLCSQFYTNVVKFRGTINSDLCLLSCRGNTRASPF